MGNSAAFEVWRRGRLLGTCAMQIPGRHNVLNALAALAACHEAGVDFGLAAAALTRFRGTARRFEVKGQAEGITLVDDYAHHPTEIEATLAAARLKYPGRPIWAVFQPHTYSRTTTLLEGFAAAFGKADHVIVTDIYAAREENTLGMSGSDLVQRMDHPDTCFVAGLQEAASALLERIQSGDVIITLGAGDGYLVGEWVLEALVQQGNESPARGRGQRFSADHIPEAEDPCDQGGCASHRAALARERALREGAPLIGAQHPMSSERRKERDE